MSELVIDLFAGGGGASEGIRLALGRDPDAAINHDRLAVALHKANHPETVHYCQDIWAVSASPRFVTKGRPVGLLWASPDCTHFSKAKGAAPKRDEKRRDLAWVVEKWAREVRPRVIAIENVEEFLSWGPLDRQGRPIQTQAGTSFVAWTRALRRLGYSVQWRTLRACDYGAPTIRKRLFIVARCDGLPIVWPTPTHGNPKASGFETSGLLPWRTAAECLDWSLPCQSIFERKKPLAEATMRRIAKGLKRYVIDSASPFIVTCNHVGQTFRGQGLDEPMKTVTAARDAPGSAEEPGATITTGGNQILAAPYFIPRYGEAPGQEPRCRDITKPLPTVVTTGNGAQIVAPCLIGIDQQGARSATWAPDDPLSTVVTKGKHALVAAFLPQHNTGVVGHAATEPLSTATCSGSQQQVVLAHLDRQHGRSIAADPGQPLPTVTSKAKTAVVASSSRGMHAAEVKAFLIKYYGSDQDPRLEEPMHTATTKDRFGLVMVNGEPHVIADIGMRMLSPSELFRAQGFPDTYQIDLVVDGRPLSKADQVRMCGNSVCPPIAAAIARANYSEEQPEIPARRRVAALPLLAAAGR